MHDGPVSTGLSRFLSEPASRGLAEKLIQIIVNLNTNDYHLH
jgi:hypothetical protein